MTRYSSIFLNSVLVAISVFCTTVAQTRKEYADWLYDRGDYFRAISQYRELMFFSKNADSINLYRYQIGKAYFHSGKHDNSIGEFTSLLENPVSEKMRCNSLNFIALNYLNLSVPTQALFYSDETLKSNDARSLFTAGLIRANLFDWKNAEKYFTETVDKGGSDTLAGTAKYNIKLLENARSIKNKSPLLGMFMSAVVPGAGQFYSEHYIDAVQAFVFVGCFTYMSYMAYKYDNGRDKGYMNFGISISITSLFYLANIIGAERTAVYYNLKQKQDFVRRINERSFSVYD